MSGRPRWQRLLLPLLLLGVALAMPVGLARQAIRAERVSIQVESCDLSGPKATQACRGTWLLADGRVASGPVDSVHLRLGTEVPGWGNGDRATTDLFTWLVMPILVGAALLVGLGAFVVVWLRLTWRARRAGAAPR